MPDEVYSGAVITTLLVYVQQRCNVDLMHSEYHQFSTIVTRTRGATHFFFTEQEKVALLNDPSPTSETELRDFFNQFHETTEAQTGKAMLDGLIALQVALCHASHDKVILLSVE